MLGFSGKDFVIIFIFEVKFELNCIYVEYLFYLDGQYFIVFNFDQYIIFYYLECLMEYVNGMIFIVFLEQDEIIFEEIYFLVGGGFVVKVGEMIEVDIVKLFYFINFVWELSWYCVSYDVGIWQVVFENEKIWREEV